MSTGNRIRARRETLGLSREELAKKLKTTRMTVWRVEQGVAHLREDKLRTWAKALRTKVTELVA